MKCCQAAACGTGRFFSHFATRYRKRYRRRGFERSQEQILAGLGSADLGPFSVLDIGCGVGYLHQELLRRGATHALGVDLSDRMLDEARILAGESGLTGRVDYRLGDFVELAPAIESADVTLLDKVICCYPDAQTLIARALEKTRRAVVLTYPRSHVFNRVMLAAAALTMALLRSGYRPYFYEPAAVSGWIEGRGFRPIWRSRTPVWLTEVYVRET
ncbi:MAG: class I SAM-dependent methyltransferase [Acidiferrobacteraceae bacterium]